MNYEDIPAEIRYELYLRAYDLLSKGYISPTLEFTMLSIEEQARQMATKMYNEQNKTKG